MQNVDSVLAWFQTKIGNYDKQSWEQSVEQRILQGLENRPKKEGSLKAELIDVDLVRGSAFTKTKPQHGWMAVLLKGLLRIIFLPFYYKYWRQHTSPRVAKYCVLHYCLQLVQIVLYRWEDYGDGISFEEVFLPIIVAFGLGVCHAQIVSPYGTKKKKNNQADSPNETAVRKKQKTRRPQRKGPADGAEHVEKNIVKKSSSEEESPPSDNNNLKEAPDEGSPVRVSAEGTDEEHEELRRFIDAKNKKIPDPVPYTPPPFPERRRHRSFRSSYSGEGLGIPTLGARESPVRVLNNRTNVPHSAGPCRQNRSQSTCGEMMPSAEKRGIRFHLQSPPPGRQSNNEEGDRVHLQKAGLGRLEVEVRPVERPDEEPSPAPPRSATPVPPQTVVKVGKPLNEVVNGQRESGLVDSEGRSTSTSNSSAERGAAGDESSHSRPDLDVTGQGKIASASIVEQEDTHPVASYVSDPTDLVAPTKPGKSCMRRKRRRSASQGETQAGMGITGSVNGEAHIKDVEVRQASPSSEPQPSLTRRLHSHYKNGQAVADGLTEKLKKEEQRNIESSNEDTFTSNARTRVLFEQLFRIRSEATRRGGTPQTNGAAPDEYSSNETDGQGDRDRPTNIKFQVSPILMSPKPRSGFLRQFPFWQNLRSKPNPASETEYDRMNSDVGSTDDSTSADEGHVGPTGEHSEKDLLPENPFVLWYRETHHGSGPVHSCHASATETVSCYIWEGEELKKADLTVLDIGWSIIQAVERHQVDTDYVRLGFGAVFLLALIPLFFRTYFQWTQTHALPATFLQMPALHTIAVDIPSAVGVALLGSGWKLNCIIILGMLLRFSLYSLVCFLMSVAERTFEQRLQYAKHFCYLTSSRRARKYTLPHFRLNKVRNIKFWLSLRSYLKKRGPQRSVDCIVTWAFYLLLVLSSILCVHMIQSDATVLSELLTWDLIMCTLALGVFLLRFLTLGTKITKKYRNLSVLITEQINLYLAMEKKPHKKAELMLANNVLKLAEDLLKELDGPFRVCGWSINPFVYNVLKVVILSASSAVISKFIGFKIKLYKIKINPTNW